MCPLAAGVRSPVPGDHDDDDDDDRPGQPRPVEVVLTMISHRAVAVHSSLQQLHRRLQMLQLTSAGSQVLLLLLLLLPALSNTTTASSIYQEAQPPLRKQGVSFVLSSQRQTDTSAISKTGHLHSKLC